MAEWIKACSNDQVGEGTLFGFEHGGEKILLSRHGGVVRATGLICTHADADLSLGMLSGEGVRCPLHLSVFDLESGVPKNPPAEKPLRVYNVKIDGGGIYVEI